MHGKQAAATTLRPWRMKRRRHPICVVAAVSACVLAAASCSSDTETTITPRGGTSRIAGAVTVSVPENAVASDTTFSATPTASLSPAEPDSGVVQPIGDAFDVTASNPLSQPVSLAVDVIADRVPDGAGPSVMFLATTGADGTGIEIAGTRVSDGTTDVGADTEHMSPWQPFVWVPDQVRAIAQGVLTEIFGPAAAGVGPPACTFAQGTSATVTNASDSDLDVCVTSVRGDRGHLRVFNRRSHAVTLSFGDGATVIGAAPRDIPDQTWQWMLSGLGANVVVPAGSEVTLEVPLAPGSKTQVRAIADLGSLLLNLSSGIAKFFVELKLKLHGGSAADAALMAGELFQCGHEMSQNGSIPQLTIENARDITARAVDVLLSCSGQLGKHLGGAGWLVSFTALASSIFKATAATYDTGGWIVSGERIITAERTRSARLPTTSASGDPVKAAIDFLKSQKAVCDRYADRVGNPRVPASYWDWLKPFTDDHPDPTRIWIVDGAGNILTVDTARRIVSGENGPDDLLPTAYEFGCPPEVFVGPAND